MVCSDREKQTCAMALGTSDASCAGAALGAISRARCRISGGGAQGKGVGSKKRVSRIAPGSTLSVRGAIETTNGILYRPLGEPQ